MTEAAAWALGVLIGQALGLCFGYRLGFTNCDRMIRRQYSRRRRSRRAAA